MVKREQLCIPKDFGGLGIMNTKIMSEALVGKWVQRMLKADKEDICYNMLKRRQLRNKSIVQSEEGTGSQFWKGVIQAKKTL